MRCGAVAGRALGGRMRCCRHPPLLSRARSQRRHHLNALRLCATSDTDTEEGLTLTCKAAVCRQGRGRQR
eukprot:2559482-Rhodomonas_salina.2